VEEGWQAFWAEHTNPVAMGDMLNDSWLNLPEAGREQMKQFMRRAFVAGGLHGVNWALDNTRGGSGIESSRDEVCARCGVEIRQERSGELVHIRPDGERRVFCAGGEPFGEIAARNRRPAPYTDEALYGRKGERA
jgi:hypothetical protein